MSTAKTMRLLKAVKIRYPRISLRQIRELIAAGKVLVNGKTAKERSLVTEDADIAVTGKRLATLTPSPDAACHILKKTRDYLFLEKPPDVHSVAHDFEETNSVANWLLSVDPSSADLHPLECGLAHRLDFETSGVMVAARNATALEWIRDQFRSRDVKKEYECLVAAMPPDPGVYEAIAGKHPKSARRIRIGNRRGKERKKESVLTEILSVQRDGPLYRLRVRLITGYRHQIRAHLAFLGCPIVGDKIYGGDDADRLMLHAKIISFMTAHGSAVDAESPVPF